MDTIPGHVLDLPIRGRGLEAPTLGAQLAGRVWLVEFLRHFG